MNRTMTMTPSSIDDILAAQGRGNDTIVAHISPREAKILKQHGGSGTINPKTGMLEFEDDDAGVDDAGVDDDGMGGFGGGFTEGFGGFGDPSGRGVDVDAEMGEIGMGGYYGGEVADTATGGSEVVPATGITPVAGTATGTAPRSAAQLLRFQFEDWQKTYKPIELAAINQLSFNNPEILPKALSVARESATGYSNAMSGILERQTRSLGQQPTGEQKTTSDRILNLNRAAAIAGAENTARENVRSQDEQILLGAAPNPNIQKAA